MKFFAGKKPSKAPKYVIPEWKPFKVGDIIEMKGAFFQISSINPLARQMILRGIQDPTKQTGGHNDNGNKGKGSEAAKT